MNNKVAGPTAGGVSEIIASDSKLTALSSKGHKDQSENYHQTERQKHLSPEDGGQPIYATTMTAQSEQAKKHD